MSIEPIPKIEPLISDLKSFQMGEYLKSNNFKRFAIRGSFENLWRSIFKQVQDERKFVVFGMDFDHDRFDSLDALTYLLNYLYENSYSSFFLFIEGLLRDYTEWNKKDLNVSNIIIDLELLNAPSNVIDDINRLSNYYSHPVPKSNVPDTIWNADKLEISLQKMDTVIAQKDYNAALTYAYSCLEGLYKSFIQEKIAHKVGSTDKLNQLAAIVRDYIKDFLQRKEVDYPEQVINLIPTITNAISSARNDFSASHFNQDADKWLAEFSRDCVNSIGRLIIKFI